MKLGFTLALLLSIPANAAYEAFQLPLPDTNANGAPNTHLSFPTGAQNAAREIWNGIRNCGLEVRNAYDPLLPRPQIIALSAIVANVYGHYQVLGYYNEEDLGTSLIWQAPNGGYQYRISYQENRIEFVTPRGGRVAWANRYFNPAGMQFNFWLRGEGQVNYDYWHQGVLNYHINPLVAEFCRFSPGPSRIPADGPRL